LHRDAAAGTVVEWAVHGLLGVAVIALHDTAGVTGVLAHTAARMAFVETMEPADTTATEGITALEDITVTEDITAPAVIMGMAGTAHIAPTTMDIHIAGVSDSVTHPGMAGGIRITRAITLTCRRSTSGTTDGMIHMTRLPIRLRPRREHRNPIPATANGSDSAKQPSKQSTTPPAVGLFSAIAPSRLFRSNACQSGGPPILWSERSRPVDYPR
jgi:hypothetical protein